MLDPACVLHARLFFLDRSLSLSVFIAELSRSSRLAGHVLHVIARQAHGRRFTRFPGEPGLLRSPLFSATMSPRRLTAAGQVVRHCRRAFTVATAVPNRRPVRRVIIAEISVPGTESRRRRASRGVVITRSKRYGGRGEAPMGDDVARLPLPQDSGTARRGPGQHHVPARRRPGRVFAASLDASRSPPQPSSGHGRPDMPVAARVQIVSSARECHASIRRRSATGR